MPQDEDEEGENWGEKEEVGVEDLARNGSEHLERRDKCRITLQRRKSSLSGSQQFSQLMRTINQRLSKVAKYSCSEKKAFK